MADGSITHWILRLRSDREIASDQLFVRFRQRVLLFARNLLATTSRSVRDEEDIALEAFADLYQGFESGAFSEVANREDFWKVLASITYCRAADYRRWTRAECRHLPDSFATAGLQAADAVADSRSRAAELAELSDFLQILFVRLEDANLQRAVLLKFEGYTNEEIAQECRCAVRTVERRLRTVRQRWIELCRHGPSTEDQLHSSRRVSR